MAGKPIDYENLLSLVEQIMGLCAETTAMSEALASLLIDKGLVTRAELDLRIEEHAKKAKKFADALGSSGGES